MLIAFILTMPNVGSWNGKWTGESNLYARVYNLPKAKAMPIIEKKNFLYDFRDGWVANIEARKVNSSEAAKIRKNTKGFCSYDWMIDSILKDGYIHT